MITKEDVLEAKRILYELAKKGNTNNIGTIGIEYCNSLIEKYINQPTTLDSDVEKFTKLRKWWLKQDIEWRTNVIDEYNKVNKIKLRTAFIDMQKEIENAKLIDTKFKTKAINNKITLDKVREIMEKPFIPTAYKELKQLLKEETK